MGERVGVREPQHLQPNFSPLTLILSPQGERRFSEKLSE
jgi:hypothetical protein